MPLLAISFGVICVACFNAFAMGGLAHEALRHMDRTAEPLTKFQGQQIVSIRTFERADMPLI